MRYFPKVTGERIYLAPTNPDDAEQYVKWLNDPAVAVYLGQYPNMITPANEKKFIEQMNSGNSHDFAIVRKDGDELLGNISLMELDHRNRKAVVGLFIGEDENRGKGYGTEAMRLILDYGFNTLNFHSVMLIAHSDNERGLACYRKVGFREVGRRRDAKLKDGHYVDDVYMDILDTEFNG